jgi:hypothetical protein
VAVGKVQVEQYQRGCLHLQAGESIGEAGDAVHLDWGFAFDQTQAYQVRVSGVVFDQ